MTSQESGPIHPSLHPVCRRLDEGREAPPPTPHPPEAPGSSEIKPHKQATVGWAGTRRLIFPFDKSGGVGALGGSMHILYITLIHKHSNTQNRLHIRSLQVVTPSVRSNHCIPFPPCSSFPSSRFLPVVIFKYSGDVWFEMLIIVIIINFNFPDVT